MSIHMIVWMATGIAVGLTHAASLWRSSHAGTQGWSAAWRLPVVAAVLVFAALAHMLLPVIVGWFAGFSVACTVYLLRGRRWK